MKHYNRRTILKLEHNQLIRFKLRLNRVVLSDSSLMNRTLKIKKRDLVKLESKI